MKEGLKGSSLWWRDLISLGADLPMGKFWFGEVAKKKLGNGETTKFWTEKWMCNESIKSLFPALYERCDCKNTFVADMGSWSNHRWQWNWAWLNRVQADLNAEELGTAEILKEMLLGLEPVRDAADRWVWLPDNVKGFTVKSCFGWLCNSIAGTNTNVAEDVEEACTKLWKNDVPTKASILSWRIILDRLPTRSALHRRGVLTSIHDLCCVLCSREEETSPHLFCTCQRTKKVWQGIYNWLGSDLVTLEDPVADFIQFGSLCKKKKTRGCKQLIWMATVWSIWTARNHIIFKGEVQSVNSIILSVKYLSWGRFIARRGKNSGLTLSDWLNCPMGCLYSI